MRSPMIAGKKLVFAPILRAGMGFLDGMLTLVPSARVAHIGLYRDPGRRSPPSSIISRPPPISPSAL
jgi:uracil phosphoribosyltransferase